MSPGPDLEKPAAVLPPVKAKPLGARGSRGLDRTVRAAPCLHGWVGTKGWPQVEQRDGPFTQGFKGGFAIRRKKKKRANTGICGGFQMREVQPFDRMLKRNSAHV